MKRWGIAFFLLIYFPLVYNNASAQNISNEGTDFWTVFPSHDPSIEREGPLYANITVYVTSKLDSKVRVRCGSYDTTSAINANQVTPFKVPRKQAYIEFEERNKNLTGRGIHVEVVPGFPKVAVYAHIFAGARSAASLILPQESLGQKYFSMNYKQTVADRNDSRNLLTLVASEPNTKLLIHAGSAGTIPVNLANAGDVYQYVPQDEKDLTGAYVEIDPNSPDNCTKRFAAFSGSTSVSIGCDKSRDPLYQQLYPTTSWGKNYNIIPFKNRYYYYRVLAEEDNTEIFVNNMRVALLTKGEYYPKDDRQIPLSQPLIVSANKKISVAQYALTQECGSARGLLGDPEMVLLNPVEFNIKNVTLFSSNEQNISERYINVSIKTSARSTFKLNGQQLADGNWSLIPSNPDFSYTQVQVYTDNSTLTANEGFNAIAYGFGDFESYAYSAGTNLAANNYLQVSNSVTQFDSPNACIEQESDFKIVFPFRAQDDKITWQLDNNPVIEIVAPPRIFNSANGDLLFEYLYDANKIFPSVEEHSMFVKATMPNIGTCIGRPIEYSFIFNSFPIPTASFGGPDQECFDAEIEFKDNSRSNNPNLEINRWRWDFGDGTTSTEQNPKHVYATSGEFMVSLSSGVETGCMSDPVFRRITIRPKINADFRINPVECITSEVVVLDFSSVENNLADITSWSWDFGDNSQKVTTQIAKHTYSAPGTYQVTLIVGTDNGCFSKPRIIPVVIKGLPEVKFASPKVCINDVTARFVNNSTDADGSELGLTFLWDFGDAGSPLNFSTEKDAAHKYSKPGVYSVKLTVVTADGCINQSVKDFTVNGSAITTHFDVANVNDLCSNNKVTITNNSFVDSGNLTRIVWTMDETKPGESIIEEDPIPGGTFDFSYPTATSNLPVTYTIVARAYSGISCSEEFKKTITINPSPNIVFDPIPPICVNGGIMKIDQAKETLGVPGRFSYSGPGITEDGTFDPSSAGPGTHTLSYTYKTDSGCEEIKTQSIVVFPIPEATFTRDVFLYTGEQKKLDLKASGEGLTFKWQPSANLDRDDIQNPIVTANGEMIYTVNIISSKNCAITEKIYIHVIPEIEISNAFSPNGDGKNDVWLLKNIENYLNASIEIFNRYGQRVYFSKGFYKPFDGNYKDQPLPVGTYYYIINPNNGRKILTGPLTIIR